MGRSFPPESDHGIHSGGAACWKVRSGQCHHQHQRARATVCCRVQGFDTVKKPASTLPARAPADNPAMTPHTGARRPPISTMRKCRHVRRPAPCECQFRGCAARRRTPAHCKFQPRPIAMPDRQSSRPGSHTSAARPLFQKNIVHGGHIAEVVGIHVAQRGTHRIHQILWVGRRAYRQIHKRAGLAVERQVDRGERLVVEFHLPNVRYYAHDGARLGAQPQMPAYRILVAEYLRANARFTRTPPPRTESAGCR